RQSRKGAPHTVHAHGLHARGHLIVEELFPGFTDELVAAGIPTGDLGEMRWYFNARQLQPAHTGLASITAPRPVLEHHVPARVDALPNVTFHERCDILGLLTTATHDRVTGVQIQPRTPGAPPQDLIADLVVDATGRGSRLPAWLDEFGYPRPKQD